MDRHIVPGITLKDATEAHRLDVAIQDEYGCKAITFWLDEERGCAFCLIEAPEEQAVRDLHDDAHGLIPHDIIEVDKRLVKAFLGRISDPFPEDNEENAEIAQSVFYDPAYRVIMVIYFKEAALVLSKYGRRRGRKLFGIHSKIIEDAVERHDGQEIHHNGDGYMVSFASVSNSMDCVAEIQKGIENYNSRSTEKIYVAVGLSSGDPVTEQKDIFGEAIQLANHLCYLSDCRTQIMVSSEVMEKYGVNRFRSLSETIPIEALSSAEEDFLSRLMDITEDTWDRPEYNLKYFCKEIGLSRSQLYRKITALTGRSFVDFIKEFRLKRAVKLLEKDQDRITQVAFETGFNNPSYFSKCFRERFGMLPSEFAKTVR